MDTISGLPAHPLLVHAPVVLLPLAALGVVVLLARTTWYQRYRWAVLFVAGAGTLGAILAASSGEGLEEQMRAKEGAEAMREIHDHVEAGDLARTLAIVFFAVLALYVVIPWFLDRRDAAAAAAGRAARSAPTWMRPVLMVAVAITAVASVTSVINAGHSGASRAWEEYSTSGESTGG